MKKTAKQRAEEYARKNPNASVREIEGAAGVGHGTAQRARDAVPRGTPETVTGRDGKQYPAWRETAPDDPFAAARRLLAELEAKRKAAE